MAPRAATLITLITLTALTALAALAAGCTATNEDYCADDTACLALGQVCHDEGHFCHKPCVKDDDCSNPAAPGYLASRPFCNPTSGDCVSLAPDAGVVDGAPPPRKNGEACGKDGQCSSGHCVSSVCCDTACDGASSCTGGQVTGPTCLTGACQTSTNSCNGYTCRSAGDTCRTTCSAKSDCSGTFECVGQDCVNELAPGAYCGTNPKACKSGFCVDQVCCDTACDGACESCGLTGSAGVCTLVPAGQDLDKDCKGASAACDGSCDGAGACSYPDATTSCGALSCKTSTLTTPVCDGKGGCVDQTASCSPHRCDGGGTACATGCADHSGCVSASACDRRLAHADTKGLGDCVDTAKIITVGPTEEIAAALTKLTSAKPYLVVPSGTYVTPLSISGVTAHLIGKGTSSSPVTLDPSATGPAVIVGDGSTVSIQGLTIDGATGSAGHGVQCTPLTSAALVLLEDQITNNTGIGIGSDKCDVTVRRTVIQSNQGGGAKLTGGKLVLESNLITNNGKSGPAGSALGGLEINSSAGSSTFVNNTVADNYVLTGKTAGIICTGAAVLRNSIIYGNIGAAQLSGCSTEYSDVQGGVSGTSNISADPKFDATYRPQEITCHDSGLTTATGITTLDLANNPRVKGSGVDMGAYEVK